MDPVSRVDQVLRLLRRQLSERTGKGAQATARPGVAAPPGGAEPRLDALIGQRVADVRAAGLTDERALVRVLLEEILVAQFGRELVNEPGFQRVVEDVQTTLDDDPGLHDAIVTLLREDRAV